MYPKELELLSENFRENKVSFLDLEVTIIDSNIEIFIYFFPFPIIRMPTFSINIPSSMFYSSVRAEVRSIAMVWPNLTNSINF